MSSPSVRVKDNGPLVVRGPIQLEDGSGATYQLDTEVVALCRCGHSANKPFCDGSHTSAGWDSTVRCSE